ncbi:MAG: bifunctional [glutamine synthetase] adenylyltransferase/[glutamine synthetase]-adenylyl-L-tyrosine phosphorylase [Pseudomonadota bacterium]
MTGAQSTNVKFVVGGPVPVSALSEEAAHEALDDLLAAAIDLPDLNRFLSRESSERELLLASMSLSPYLRDIAVTHPECVLDLLGTEPLDLLDNLVAEVRRTWKDHPQQTEFMAALRRLKRRFAFVLALYDLGRILDTPIITAWMSAFARACVSSAVDHLLLGVHNEGKLQLHDVGDPGFRSGLAVIGMGKLGSSELNYSSDIDLVVVFDPAANIVKIRDEASNIFSRIVRILIRILQERTADGYVFRTDLRLRPDPGSTPLALPFSTALHYYEARGQNWERAAFIKADVAGGDLATGAAFCAELAPFIYRKYLDYGAIADIHSIKRQIHVSKGFGEISARGHNIKLGRGGIREVEFFVQTQQLIAGGRMTALRTRSTDTALTALAQAQWISESTEEALRKAYWFLRDTEHRIQMRRDEQSHIVPESDDAFHVLSLMMGFDEPQLFEKKLVATLRLVEKHYARLFEQERQLTAGAGNLVFTGDEDDPETLETLKRMGFERPSDMSRIIRGWHYGRYRATQTATARKRLTELMPDLLQTFADSGRPDDTVLRFDSFLAGLPAGIQLFSLLCNNSGLMSLLVTIMASAPRLANVIARKPHIFDGMLDPTLLAELPTRALLSERLEAFLDGEFAYEEVLDRLRIFASEQRFLVGVRLLTGAIAGDRAALAFSDLADLTLNAAMDAVRIELEQVHGKIAGGRIAVVGLGKFGSREMTAASDVDIILLYAHDPDCQESDGPKPIDPVRYFTRFTQRLTSALSAPTAEGVLYDVDLRLRPSGNKGPVATSIRAYRKYQQEHAWTWEHMALTRARIVAGDPTLKAEAEEIFRQVLHKPRDIDKTVADIAHMRNLIEAEKPAHNQWDLKLVVGGLIDIEFISQFLCLQIAAHDQAAPEPGVQTGAVLKSLAPPMIGDDDAQTLIEALELYTQLSQIIRLCLESKFEPEDAPQGFKDLMLRRTGYPDMRTLEALLTDTSQAVRGVFERTIVHRKG